MMIHNYQYILNMSNILGEYTAPLTGKTVEITSAHMTDYQQENGQFSSSIGYAKRLAIVGAWLLGDSMDSD